jgi:PAS domain S-box-containing protein
VPQVLLSPSIGLSVSEADEMTDEIQVREDIGGQENIEPRNVKSKAAFPRPHRGAGQFVPVGITREEALRRLEGMSRFAQLVADSNRDRSRLMRSTARMLSEMVGDMTTITLLNTDNETYHVAAYDDTDPAVVVLFEQVLAEVASIPRDQGWVARVIQSGKPMLLPGITLEQAVASAVPTFIEFTRRVGIASMLIVPIIGRSGALGAISLTRHTGSRPYTEDDQSFLMQIAKSAGEAIENYTIIDSLRQELSARLFAKEALAASEQRFLSLFHSTTLGVKVMDLVGTMLETNPAFQALTGYKEEDLIASHFYDIVHPDDVARAIDVFTRLKLSREPHARLEHRLIRSDGAVIWVRTTFATVRKSAGDNTPSLIFGIAEDFTERKRAEVELLELKQHLQRSIELERLRLAQNLHDVPLQELYAVIYKLEELRARSDDASARLLRGVIDDIQRTLNSLRTTASELRPPALSRFGLEKAIRSYVEDFREKHPDIRIRLSLARDRQLLSETVRLLLFRVFQEAMANMLRHAQATEVQVRFTFDAEEARLEICDNGKGFTVPASWTGIARQGHYGLAGMAERVTAAGGLLIVESSPDSPTTIRVTIPCSVA